MPDYQSHCESCQRKIGKSCGEVHRWMDEPVKMMGAGHRVYRHDIKRTPELAKKIWDRRYEQGLTDITGDEARETCIDHILLDKSGGELPRIEIPMPSIAHAPFGGFSLSLIIGIILYVVGITGPLTGALLAMGILGGILGFLVSIGTRIEHPGDIPWDFGLGAFLSFLVALWLMFSKISLASKISLFVPVLVFSGFAIKFKKDLENKKYIVSK